MKASLTFSIYVVRLPHLKSCYFTTLTIYDKASKFWSPLQCNLLQLHFSHSLCLFFFLWRCSPTRAMAYSFLMRFVDHTQRLTTVSRTSLDEWSARRSDFYLTTHNTHNRKTSTFPAGFGPTISTGERPQYLRLRPSSHWDRLVILLVKNIIVSTLLQ